MKNVLVTGGAGFIGSHTVDLLLERGYRVRVLDSLERPTHLGVAPEYLDSRAELVRGDLRHIDDLARALWGMDAVVHLAAAGGFSPDRVRYLDSNSIGTANLLELIQQPRYRVRRVVVASSVAVYGEGAYRCACGPRPGEPRSLDQLEARQWELRCRTCGGPLEPVPTGEEKMVSPETAYAISKFDQERLVLSFGREHGVACCALRYFLTYGPRQSLSNPYTGVISIFASRILNGLRPIVFEDGRQTRDFVWVGDVARANLLALERDQAAGSVFNVGSGEAHRVADVAGLLAELLGRPDLGPELTGDFRPGDSRHLYADVTKIRELLGFAPTVSLREGLRRWLEWVRGANQVEERFSAALAGLKRGGVVRSSRHAGQPPAEDSLTVAIPAYNEAGNLDSLVRHVLSEVARFVDDFEIIVVDDGSRDGTGLIADRLAQEDPRVRVFHHPFNVGYGGAQKTSFRNATKNWVVLIPADHQFDVRDLGKFLAARESADIVGSFRIDRQDSLRRRVISRLFNGYMRHFHGVPLRDLNWIKLFRRRIFDQIEIESRTFAVDGEIVVKAHRLGYRIAEIPVEHHPRTWGSPTGITFKNLYTTARELMRVKGMVERTKVADGEARTRVGDDPDTFGAQAEVAGEPGSTPPRA